MKNTNTNTNINTNNAISNKLLIPALCAALLLGIGFGVCVAFATPIISDAVNPGLYAYEFWHGNYQWYVPVSDPYVLDYLLNIITAPLFNYEPRALFVGSYALFAGSVLLIGLCARRLSGKRGEDGIVVALAASALAANTGGLAMQYLVYPVWHGSTLFLGLLAIYLYLGKPTIHRLLGLTLLFAFGTYCDTLFLPIFVAPLLATEALRYYRAYRQHEKYHGVLAPFVFAAFGYFVKAPGGEMWPNGPYIVNVGGLGAIMGAPDPGRVSDYAFAVISMAGGPIALSALCIALYMAWTHRKESRELVAFVAVSCAAMAAGFLFMFSAGGDLGRYVYIIVPLAAIPIALLGFNKKTMGLYLIPALLVFGAANNAYSTVNAMDDSFKSDAVVFLEKNNVTTGYADYWLANLMRYMSHEEIRLRPVFVNDGALEYLSLQSSSAWLNEGWPTDGAPVVDNTPVLVTYGAHDPVQGLVHDYAAIGITPYETLNFTFHDPQTSEPCELCVYKYNRTLPAGPVDVPYFARAQVKPV